jgi:hypothetical protein
LTKAIKNKDLMRLCCNTALSTRLTGQRLNGGAELPTLHAIDRGNLLLSLPQSDPHILMVESTEHGPHFDAPVVLNGPSNGCILPLLNIVSINHLGET